MNFFLLNSKTKPDNIKLDSGSKDLKKTTPWVEKYRPKTMDEVVYQDEVVAVLKKCINGSDFPNLLFYGPPGTGKTSTILAASKELFGSKYYRDRVLELNASDERGIAVIREKVKRFSQNLASEKLKCGDGDKGIPGFKLVILDEADSMTSAAQSALRRTMEVSCKSTRFCLICNYVTRIIDPLTSRCAKFRFKPLAKEVSVIRLADISESEGIKVPKDVLEKLVDIAEGDLRRAITMLQSSGLLAIDGIVDEKMITEIAGTIPVNFIQQFIDLAKSNSFDRMKEFVNIMLNSGYSVAQFIDQLQDTFIKMDIKDNLKASFLEKLSRSEEQLTIGTDEYLQFMSIACFCMKQFSEN